MCIQFIYVIFIFPFYGFKFLGSGPRGSIVRLRNFSWLFFLFSLFSLLFFFFHPLASRNENAIVKKTLRGAHCFSSTTSGECTLASCSVLLTFVSALACLFGQTTSSIQPKHFVYVHICFASVRASLRRQNNSTQKVTCRFPSSRNTRTFDPANSSVISQQSSLPSIAFSRYVQLKASEQVRLRFHTLLLHPFTKAFVLLLAQLIIGFYFLLFSFPYLLSCYFYHRQQQYHYFFPRYWKQK